MEDKAISRLFEISYKTAETPLTSDERIFVNEMLISNNENHVIISAMILMGEKEEHIDKILEMFNTYPLLTKKILIPNLASLYYYKAYKFLFEYLKETTIPELAATICICLAKTEYPVTPYLLYYLEKSNKNFEKKLVKIIKYMGIKKLKKHLALLPVIPKESVFREVFGDLEINFIKTLSKKHQDN
mgnify:CR=1 FL=1